MQSKNYRENGGRNGLFVSQSMIKSWKVFSPKKWSKKYIENIQEEEEENPNFLLGDLLDCLVSTPELLESRYYVADLSKLPSETECHIIECVYEEILKSNKSLDELNEFLPESTEKRQFDLSLNKDLVCSCIEKFAWQAGWKEETKFNKIVEKGEIYFSILAEANNRKIISSSLNMQAIELVDILKSDKNTRDYLVPSEDNELLFQLEIFGEYEFEDNKIQVKGALDLLRINYKDKTLQICDFKKTFSSHQFIESLRKFDYCGQISFYSYLIFNFWLKDNPQYQDYKILNPINICIDVIDRYPYIYEYNQNDLDLSRCGNAELLRKLYGDNHIFKIKIGWQETLETIGWHLSKNNFTTPKEMIQNGKIQINLLNN